MSPIVYQPPERHDCDVWSHLDRRPGDPYPPDGTIWQCPTCHQHWRLRYTLIGKRWIPISRWTALTTRLKEALR